jgi:hypothetical protein
VIVAMDSFLDMTPPDPMMRDNITSANDLREAAQRLDAYESAG